MSEKEPQVTFTDRRKISSDGEIRPEAAAQSATDREEANRRDAARQEAERKQAESQPAAQQPRQQSEPVHTAPSTANQAGGQAPVGDKSARNPEVADEKMPDGPTAQESAESHAAYSETTKQLDELLRAKAPDSGYMGPVSFDHLVQSMYMTAMMGLGAGTQPGEKPRIDLMGARQTIDLLGVLGEKTKGNLTSDEQRLLESALFELRMMFLEITNAIARNAANPGQQQQPKRK